MARILNHIEANSIEVFLLELDFWELVGSFTSTAEEETVRHAPVRRIENYGDLCGLIHLHDVGFVDDCNLVAVVVFSILEGVLTDTSRSNFSNQLDTLDDSVNDFVFNAGVFTFLKCL